MREERARAHAARQERDKREADRRAKAEGEMQETAKVRSRSAREWSTGLVALSNCSRLLSRVLSRVPFRRGRPTESGKRSSSRRNGTRSTSGS